MTPTRASALFFGGLLCASTPTLAWTPTFRSLAAPSRGLSTAFSAPAADVDAERAELLAKRQANKEAKPFIMAELRPYAMKLHTREQAPREGQAASPPPRAWEPTSAGYLQFLVDSRHVYTTLEGIVGEREDLKALQ